MSYKREGSISVYLALSMIIIVSMVLTMLEAAKYSVRNSYSSILLNSASESVMGEFYGPLFEDYHLYGIDTGFGTRKKDIDELENRILSYIPENNWGFAAETCEVTDYSLFMENNGKEFLNQAYEYEKYAAAGSVIEDLLERMSLLADVGKMTKVYERSTEIESELAEIDEYTLDLMKYIDGVEISTSWFSDSANYELMDGFVKRMWVINDKTSGEMPVNNPVLFNELKSYYVNPLNSVNDLLEFIPGYIEKLRVWNLYRSKKSDLAAQISDLKLSKSELEEQIGGINDDILSINSEIDEVKNSGKTSKQIKKEVKSLETKITSKKKEISSLEKEIKEIDTKVDELEKEIEKIEKYIQLNNPTNEENIKYIKQRLLVIRTIIGETKEYLVKTENVLAEIEKKQREVRPLVSEYENYLSYETGIENEILEGLLDTLETMKAYVGIGSSDELPVDYDLLDTTVRSDLVLMNLVHDEELVLQDETSISELESILSMLSTTGKVLNSFSYEGMNFDYSELTGQSAVVDYAGLLGNWATAGIMKLLLGADANISTSILMPASLPSKYYELATSVNLTNLGIGSGNLDGMELLQLAQDDKTGIAGLWESMETLGSDILKELLVDIYLEEHFKSFTDNETRGASVLEYELEYILSGTNWDAVNLSNAAVKILLLRFIVTAIYCFSSQEVKLAASSAALLVFGITCMPFLVKMAETTIILAWAFAQAVAETAAIMKGKKVPLITNRESFCFTIFELPFFLGLVQSKADSFHESASYMKYEEYLMVFLLLEDDKEKSARAMDMIQENIRYRYNDDFLMFNCITGFSVKADFVAEASYAPLFFDLVPESLKNHYIAEASDSVHY